VRERGSNIHKSYTRKVGRVSPGTVKEIKRTDYCGMRNYRKSLTEKRYGGLGYMKGRIEKKGGKLPSQKFLRK